MDPQEMKPVRMSDYEKYLLQQQAEQSPRHNDMTIDERMTEYIEWQNTDFDRDLMVDAHLEIIKLRRERDGLTAELAAAREALEPRDYCNTCGKAQPVAPVHGDEGPYGTYCAICNNSIGSHGDPPF